MFTIILSNIPISNKYEKQIDRAAAVLDTIVAIALFTLAALTLTGHLQLGPKYTYTFLAIGAFSAFPIIDFVFYKFIKGIQNLCGSKSYQIPSN